MKTTDVTGYETYTEAERDAMIRRIEADIRQERWASDGDGLRAEVARSSVRELERQLAAIRRTK